MVAMVIGTIGEPICFIFGALHWLLHSSPHTHTHTHMYTHTHTGSAFRATANHGWGLAGPVWGTVRGSEDLPVTEATTSSHHNQTDWYMNTPKYPPVYVLHDMPNASQSYWSQESS